VLQPNSTSTAAPASILKAEILDDNAKAVVASQQSIDNKRSLQRTFRADMNDPDQPVLLENRGTLETIHSASPPSSAVRNEHIARFPQTFFDSSKLKI
jgi:hypothetical protein